MQGGIFLIAFAAIAIAIVAVVLSSQAKKKRREMLAAWAQARGWHFTPDQVSTLGDRFPTFSALRQGDNRYGYNVMRGRCDVGEAWAFDYHYETHSTDSKGNRQTHHHHFSAVVVDCGLRLTPLTLRAEGFFDKIKGAFGFDDIDFESAEFSRKFWVTSPDKRWAYEVLHQETMEYLLEAPGFALEFEAGPRAIAYRSRRFKPPEFDDAVGFLGRVIDRIPSDIRRDRTV